jgi:hypothetical protein
VGPIWVLVILLLGLGFGSDGGFAPLELESRLAVHRASLVWGHLFLNERERVVDELMM